MVYERLLHILADESRVQLGLIQDTTDGLLASAGDSPLREALERVHHGVWELSTLISDISDFYAHSAGRLSEAESDFDLRVTLDGVRTRFSRCRPQSDWIALTKVRHDVPTLLRGRPARLQDILLGAASGALDSRSPGSLRVDVTKGWEQDGRVELIQIPTDKEINDNIIAFWVPDRLPEKGKPVWFSYRMLWHYPGPSRPPAGRVTATRIAKGRNDKTKVFVIDFAGERLDALPADKPLTAVISVEPRGKLIEQQLYKNSVSGGWRLVFQISFEDPSSLEKVLPAIRRPVVELRAYLKLGDNALTETWSYAYQP